LYASKEKENYVEVVVNVGGNIVMSRAAVTSGSSSLLGEDS